VVVHRESNKIFNRILLAVPPATRGELLRHCTAFDLPSGYVIYPAGAAVEDVYFINRGLVALIKTMQDGRTVEVGAVGAEGFIGVFALHGFDNSPVDYVIEVPTQALRIGRNAFRDLAAQYGELGELVQAYRRLAVNQLMQIAACNRLHSLEQRCCHWLLVAHDNAMAESFSLTHEFLASLLGVQRPSISMTANGLQKNGLIRYCHGRLTVLDRGAIEAAACECYRSVKRQIDQVFGPIQGSAAATDQDRFATPSHENFTMGASHS